MAAIANESARLFGCTAEGIFLARQCLEPLRRPTVARLRSLPPPAEDKKQARRSGRSARKERARTAPPHNTTTAGDSVTLLAALHSRRVEPAS